MKSYLEISIGATESQRELLLPTMIELGCEGFQETDTSLLCYIDKSRWSGAKYNSFKSTLLDLLKSISSNAVIQFRDIVEENWNEQWERSLQPIEIGTKLVIKPSWTEYNNTENRIIIQIDPKMSFGTGYHETTRLTLKLLEKYLEPVTSILDVGTGTGILAIAGVKLGASSAVGIDNDQWSIDNALENVKANKVEHKIEITNKPLSSFQNHSFDAITANLTLNTNLEMLQDFKRILTNTGILLLSGLLMQDENIISKSLADNNFAILEIVRENEWIAIAAKNNL